MAASRETGRRVDGSTSCDGSTSRDGSTSCATGRPLSEKRATCSGVSYAGRGSSLVRGRLREAALAACAMESRRAKRLRED